MSILTNVLLIILIVMIVFLLIVNIGRFMASRRIKEHTETFVCESQKEMREMAKELRKKSAEFQIEMDKINKEYRRAILGEDDKKKDDKKDQS